MPPSENSGVDGGSGAPGPSPPKPDHLVTANGPLASRRELAMPPSENSGGGGGGSGSGASYPSPPKPDKGKAKLEDDPLDEDLELKQRMDLAVLMLQDSDPDVQEHALDTLRDEIRSSRCAMNAVPKPLMFLCDHYEILKACYKKRNESSLKRRLGDILSAVASSLEQTINTVSVAVRDSEEAGAMCNADEVAVSMENPWADLPCDLIISVVSMLPPCRVERCAVTNLNRYWRRVIQFEMPVPPALPWLLLPSSTTPVFHTSTSGSNWRRLLNTTADFRQHAQIRGSAEGGWVVLSLVEPLRHQLFNLNSGVFLPLPTGILIDGEVRAVNLKAAVLSGLPVPPYAYTVAALLEVEKDPTVCLALGNHLSTHWDFVTSFADDITVQDLLYYKEALYLLTADEALLKLVTQGQGHHLRDLNVTQRPGYEVDDTIYTMQRYLCESEGSLFMVVKFLNDVTLEVRPFELVVDADAMLPHCNNDDTVEEGKQPSWVDMSESKQLQGRLFFVGQGSSRSFGTTEDGGIHFLDDRRRHAQVVPEYWRDDMGTVSFQDLMIVNFPLVGNEPLPPPTSDREPPAWWLP